MAPCTTTRISACLLAALAVSIALHSSAQPRIFFVNPVTGSDANRGTTPRHAWKTLPRLNRQLLGPGDQVFIAPGVLYGSLAPIARGAANRPVQIRFLPGRHEFMARGAAARAFFVSNSADAPHETRPIGILIKNASHLKILGGKGSEIWYGDRMIELMNDQSEDITYDGLTFDMVRPTVSEFRVLQSDANKVVIRIAEGSSFQIDDGRFSWKGDLGSGGLMAQEADPVTGECWRRGNWGPFQAAYAKALGNRLVLLDFASGNPGLKSGHQYQFRNVLRDTTSAVNSRCKGIVFRDCRFYALPGMGIVSQFVENLTFERVSVVPRPGTIRTCPAWADCFHFSGCKGRVVIDSCRFSGTQDDPINVHGTHLQLVQKEGSNRVLVRFMHPQTYGFAAFQPGDRVEFVSNVSLRAYDSSKVVLVERKSDTDWVLSLNKGVPNFRRGDVIDNTTWYPDVTIRNCSVNMDSCRGFLITTRGKVLVEGNTFTNTEMSAILIADDANSWFESGPVRDVTIRGNRFLHCGDPAILIQPENESSNRGEPVHSGISIIDNEFESGGISARSVKGLTIQNNWFRGSVLPIRTQACEDLRIEENHTHSR
jgi:hypothetical protein